MSNITTADITGVFNLDTGWLIGIAPKGVNDVTYLAGQDTQTDGLPVTSKTDPLTGRNRFSITDVGEAQVAVAAPLVSWAASEGTLALISVNGAPEAVGRGDYSDAIKAAPLKCTFKASTSYNAEFNLTTGVSFAQLRTMQIPFKFSSNVGFVDGVNPIQIWIYSADFTKSAKARIELGNFRANKWNMISFAAGAATEGWSFSGGWTATTDLDAEIVTRLRIFVTVPATADGVTVEIGPLMKNARRKGMVSIVNDGEYASQRDYILPILDGYGLRSSLALVGGNIGLSTTYMNEAQIIAAYNRGHELIHHTFDNSKVNGYANATDWPTQSSIYNDIVASQAWRSSRGLSRGLNYAVHGYTCPFAQTVAQARQDLVSAAYEAAGIKAIRLMSPVYNRTQPICGAFDPLLVQGALGVTNTTTVTDFQNVVNWAISRGEWAVITLHRSVITAPAALQVLNADLDTAMAYLAGKVRSGEVDCLPFGEAAQQFGF